jgi:hypothetical protein
MVSALRAKSAIAFARTGIVKLDAAFTGAEFQALQAEVYALMPFAVRRDLRMPESGYTARSMSTIGGHFVRKYAPLLRHMYSSENIRSELSRVTETEVFLAPDPIEDVVVNILHLTGDVHGAHVDTYAYALSICIDAPCFGGELEFVQGGESTHDLLCQSVNRIKLQSGDCYLMGSRSGVHRVAPLTGPERRTVVTMAYADSATRFAHSYSTSVLYL